MPGLVGLTFGDDHSGKGNRGDSGVVRPSQGTGSKEYAKVRVIKVEQFVGTNETYVIGELMDGTISKNMTVEYNGKHGEVMEVESKYGMVALGKKGAKLGLMLAGEIKKDDLAPEVVLEFKAKPVPPKKKGRIIIA